MQPSKNVHTFWPKVAKEWEAGFDPFEHAYDLFSHKVKNTDRQMRVTDDDVSEKPRQNVEILVKAEEMSGQAL